MISGDESQVEEEENEEAEEEEEEDEEQVQVDDDWSLCIIDDVIPLQLWSF